MNFSDLPLLSGKDEKATNKIKTVGSCIWSEKANNNTV